MVDHHDIGITDIAWGRLIEHAFDEFFLFNAEDLRFVHVSRGALENLGYTPQEIKDLTPLDLKTDLTQSQFEEWLQVLREGRQASVVFQTLHRRKNGSVYLTEIRLQFLEKNTPPLFLAIGSDISERAQAADALRKNQALLSETQRIARIGSCDIDLFKRNMHCSDETYRIFEISPRNRPIALKTLMKAVHPEDRTWLEQLIEKQSIYDVVFRLRMKDGRIKYIRQYCEPRCDAQGRITRMVSTIQDVTRSHLTHLAHKKQRRLLEVLNACSEIVMQARDEETLLTRVCQTIISLEKYRCAWVGFAVKNAQKQIIPVAHAGARTGEFDQIVFRWDESLYGRGPAGIAVRTGRSKCIQQMSVDAPDGPWRAAALEAGDQSLLALPLMNNKVVFGVLNIHASEPKAFDPQSVQQLEKLAHNLAFGVNALRTQAEHAQLQGHLRQTKKMETIGQMVSGIAHDFNNRLAVVCGYLDFLREHLKGMDVPAKWVEAAMNAAEHSAKLSRQFLDFSRKQNTEKSLTQINDIFQEMNTLIARAVTPEIEVSYQLEKKLWATEVSVNELSDVILNLVMNARQAMPRGGKLIIQTKNIVVNKKHTALQAGGGGGSEYVELKLSDTGVGMSKETQAQAFEPFFTTRPEKSSTGLGLSMVNAFIKRHNGYIKLFSEPDVGTTFRIFLPRAQMDFPKKKPEDLSRIIMPTGNETILIVDDEQILLRLAEKCLTSLGYQTHLAVNAHEALQIIHQKKRIDLLFSDVVMPGGMNGFELAQKALTIQPELKVLLTSGFGTEALMQEDKKDFSANLIGKPYRRIDLAQRIRSILDQQAEA